MILIIVGTIKTILLLLWKNRCKGTTFFQTAKTFNEKFSLITLNINKKIIFHKTTFENWHETFSYCHFRLFIASKHRKIPLLTIMPTPSTFFQAFLLQTIDAYYETSAIFHIQRHIKRHNNSPTTKTKPHIQHFSPL